LDIVDDDDPAVHRFPGLGVGRRGIAHDAIFLLSSARISRGDDSPLAWMLAPARSTASCWVRLRDCPDSTITWTLLSSGSCENSVSSSNPDMPGMERSMTTAPGVFARAASSPSMPL